MEALGSGSGSRWHERVTQQPEHQKSRRDVSVAAAAQSSPIHRTLGQVRTKGLLACWILYIYHLFWLLLLVSSTAIFWINKVNFFWLRQVVSEVLFPSPVSSSPAQTSPVLPGPPAGLSSAPPRSSGRPHDMQNSVEVIAQLLQEAEGELCACVLHEQLTFITHDRYFPFCLFRFRWKGF